MYITPLKAKDKFNEMKNQLLIIKANWELSGNGDGTARKKEEMKKEGLGMNITKKCGGRSELELIDGTAKRDFLLHFSPVILYFWEMIEKNKILSDVCQQLTAGVSYDSTDNTTYIPTFDIKKRKNQEIPNGMSWN